MFEKITEIIEICKKIIIHIPSSNPEQLELKNILDKFGTIKR